jgi:muramidase (phage lysozyme)
MTIMSKNLKAFLDTIAWSELGDKLLAVSDRGYNVCVGSTPAKPILFRSYAMHPMQRCAALNSDAAGRYQFMGRYWSHYRNQLELKDFGPDAQDKWAIRLIAECKALGDVEAGRLEAAVYRCNSRWASFPGAGYGQPEHKMESLRAAFVRFGGVLSER